MSFIRLIPFVVGPRFARAVIRDARSSGTSYPDDHRLVGLPKTETFNRFIKEVDIKSEFK